MKRDKELIPTLWRAVGDWPDDFDSTTVQCEDLVSLLRRYNTAVELLKDVRIVQKRSESYGVWKRIAGFLNEDH